MTAFRTYVGMVVVFISLIFTLIGCTTITGINTTPVRADCPPAANGSITVNNIVISNQYNSVSTLSTSSALSSGYNINYYDATTGGSIGSGATVNNLNGNQLVKIEVVQSPYGFFTDFYQKALYNPPSVQLNNANFSTGNNISWTGTNAFGYGIFSNIVAPQSPGTIEIRGVTIGTSPTCHPSSFGFATNSSLAPSTDCYDFRVDFYPSSPCYITGFDYVILPWVKSGGSWNNLGIFGG